eukprot:SAG25_NODE_83_length_16558_cov_10.239307_2_plen_397_part_00
MLLHLALPLLLVHRAAGTPCNTDEDCSLLGVCVPPGRQRAGGCACDEGWTGEDCGQADLLPLDPTAGYVNASAASWGGRPVFADGKWHLFATEISRRCPLILFMNNSAVVRAESDAPQGPYIHKQTILPPFHHNPQVFGPTPDGYYLIFSIGNDKEQWEIGCEEAVPPRCTLRNNSFCRGAEMPTSNGRINLAYSQSVYGPWTEKVILPYDADGDSSAWNCENNNPTATILPNGTIVLVYRADPCKHSAGGGAGGGESLGVAVALHWNSTYVRRSGAPIVSPADGTGMHEDPFLFLDRRGNFHLITHNQATDNVCGSRDAGSACAAHLWSRDSYTWTVGRTPVYTPAVQLINGSNATFATRQRPQLLLNRQTGAWFFSVVRYGAAARFPLVPVVDV